ncbi:MAG: hypothetical protein ACC682_15575 [Gemmatimonadota bacterium]
MMISRRSAGGVLVLSAWLALLSTVGLAAQTDGTGSVARFAFESRLAFLISDTEGHPDRPVIGADARFTIRPARVGGGPGFGVTAGATVGFAEFFADVQSESFRLVVGVETPWALSASGLGKNPVEIVPLVQVGHLTSNGGDERSGVVSRLALGLRIPLGDGPMYLAFEPIGLTLLPAPDDPHEGDSRLAYELGLIKFGWRF